MIKRFPLILIVLALMSSLVMGQSINELKSSKVSFDQEISDQNAAFYIDYKNRQLNSIEKPTAVPVDLVFANWDWPCNSFQPPFSFAYDFTLDGALDPFMIATQGVAASGIERHGIFAFIDDFGATSNPVYPGINPVTGQPWRTGWNSHLVMDDNAGKTYVAIYDYLNSSGLSNGHLWEVDLLTDPSTATQLTDSLTALDSYWARFALDGNDIFWELGYNYADFCTLVGASTDGGATFAWVDSVGSNDPNFWYTEYGNDPAIIANGNKISHITSLVKGGSLSNLGLFDPDVTDPDSASGIYHWYSADGGSTWMGEMIFHDGDTVITNRRNYEPRLANWDFGQHHVDANGVTHLVFGGGGPNSNGIVGADTISVAGLYYWNDSYKNWMSLEVIPVETYAYDATLFAGNANGPYRPTVKTDPSGQLLVAMWQRHQFSGDPGNSPINVYDNPPDAQFYHTDIVYSYSEDGGVTWSIPAIAVSVADESNYFPSISAVEVGSGMATVHFVAYHDPIPGISLFAENAASPDAVWRYHTVQLPTAVSVGNEIGVVSDFQLEQNYPNPFNPSTTIKYSVPEKSDVTIRVFDILGAEVATLVNVTQEAGSYEINFDASKLSSGMYIYRLNTGDVSLSKKMMLLK
jgi:hypothetical protein